MEFFYKHRVLITVVIYCGCFFLLYPLFRYILDDDGIGYAMVTRRWAEGDFYNAINGYWSPLHSWIAIPFYKAGLGLVQSFHFSNILISIGILIIVDLLASKYEINHKKRFFFLLISVPLLIYMSYCQLAADILFCFFFLLYIFHCSAGDSFTSKRKIVVCALIAWCGYLSKAYGFPLFLVHFCLWQYWLSTRTLIPEPKKKLISNLITGISVFLILSLPWIIVLHYKYHTWTFGYSGKLNLSWQLASPVAQINNGYIVPHLLNSPTPWEDPWFSQSKLYSPFTSFSHLIRECKVILHNVIAMIDSFHASSFLSLAILFSLFLYAVKTKSGMATLFLFSILLLPLGYLLVHIEPRFLWPATFLLLIASFHLLSFLFHTYRFPQYAKLICWITLTASFLVPPLNALQDMAGSGKDVYSLSKDLEAHAIKGAFASSQEEYSNMRKASFLSGNRYFESFEPDPSDEWTLSQIRSRKIEYYFLFYRNERQLRLFQHSTLLNESTNKYFLPAHHLIILKFAQ
ncbi:MAG TPA: hypothetical protein VM012_15375 [Flavitalea sp.]|nr:hypothetical protein [Flavitalea sp.]